MKRLITNGMTSTANLNGVIELDYIAAMIYLPPTKKVFGEYLGVGELYG